MWRRTRSGGPVPHIDLEGAELLMQLGVKMEESASPSSSELSSLGPSEASRRPSHEPANTLPEVASVGVCGMGTSTKESNARRSDQDLNVGEPSLIVNLRIPSAHLAALKDTTTKLSTTSEPAAIRIIPTATSSMSGREMYAVAVNARSQVFNLLKALGPSQRNEPDDVASKREMLCNVLKKVQATVDRAGRIIEIERQHSVATDVMNAAYGELKTFGIGEPDEPKERGDRRQTLCLAFFRSETAVRKLVQELQVNKEWFCKELESCNQLMIDEREHGDTRGRSEKDIDHDAVGGTAKKSQLENQHEPKEAVAPRTIQEEDNHAADSATSELEVPAATRERAIQEIAESTASESVQSSSSSLQYVPARSKSGRFVKRKAAVMAPNNTSTSRATSNQSQANAPEERTIARTTSAPRTATMSANEKSTDGRTVTVRRFARLALNGGSKWIVQNGKELIAGLKVPVFPPTKTDPFDNLRPRLPTDSVTLHRRYTDSELLALLVEATEAHRSVEYIDTEWADRERWAIEDAANAKKEEEMAFLPMYRDPEERADYLFGRKSRLGTLPPGKKWMMDGDKWYPYVLYDVEESEEGESREGEGESDGRGAKRVKRNPEY